MANYELTKLAANILCPGNVVQTDDAGLPSVLVYIPKFKNSDVLNGGDDSTHPAFIVNGKEISGFYYSKYENAVYNGAAYSLPGEDASGRISIENARAYCEAKGPGWHLSTAAEWAAIALWCKKNGFLPYGNNNYGKDIRETNYKAIPATYGSDGRTNRIATGTGPVTWSHDGTAAGIWDLNGNVGEWQGGIRLVWGELQILANNDAADVDNPQNETSTCWKAINASTGALVEPECKTADTDARLSGNTVRIDYVASIWTYVTAITSPGDGTRHCPFGNLTCDGTIGEAAKALLKALALLPDGEAAGEYEGDGIYWINYVNERCVMRGGGLTYGGNAGLFNLDGRYGRTARDASFGFRAAYIPEIGQ